MEPVDLAAVSKASLSRLALQSPMSLGTLRTCVKFKSFRKSQLVKVSEVLLNSVSDISEADLGPSGNWWQP